MDVAQLTCICVTALRLQSGAASSAVFRIWMAGALARLRPAMSWSVGAGRTKTDQWSG